MFKHYIDDAGNYLGGWDASPPESAIEVPFPPEDARYLYIDGVWVPPAKTEEELRAEWKAQRAAAVEAIKVTTAAGNVFDGDEIAQSRMARSVIILTEAERKLIALEKPYEIPTVSWVLADDSVVVVGAIELSEALELAGAAQAALWVAP